MSEAQYFLAFTTLLAYPAENQFLTNISGGSRHEGVTCWPEAIGKHWKIYAQSANATTSGKRRIANASKCHALGRETA